MSTQRMIEIGTTSEEGGTRVDETLASGFGARSGGAGRRVLGVLTCTEWPMRGPTR